MAAAGELRDASSGWSARLRRAWHRLDRALGGAPGRLYRPLKPLAGRLLPALRG
jgi:hypothetical protein